MRIVVAPDSFKGTLAAADAAAALAAGWRDVRPDDEVIELPQADGGEGTLDALARGVPDAVQRSAGLVTGPAGDPVAGEWLELPDGTAVVELAVSSGIALMPRLDALGATSRGLGEVMAAALDAGAERLVVAVGGSASTDAGLPVLDALGDRRPPVRGAVVLTDVRAPLLGPDGAAAVYGPQKGATDDDIRMLERRLADAAARLGADPAIPGTGAAGGVAYGLLAWGADIVPGAPEIARITGLAAELPTADVVVTGEGRFDGQSLDGKVVGHLLGAHPRVLVVAGSLAAEPPHGGADLTRLAGSTEAALRDPARWLRVAGAEAARSVA